MQTARMEEIAYVVFIFSESLGGGGITTLSVLTNLLVLGAVLCLAGCPIYVDKAVQVPIEQQDGETWETAFSTIQAGVDTAVNKSIASWAVWVRGESDAISGGNPYCDGVYNEIVSVYPNRDALIYIFGGFNGTEEPYLTEEGGAELMAKERSWIKNPTYIDGTNITSGAMQLVTISRNVHIDGFTFCNGELPGGPIGFASGNMESIISNSIIEYNYAPWSMGGIAVSGGEVKIINCLFRDNIGGPGGILSLNGSGIANVINCTFDDNTASSIIYESSSATANITNSILWDNTAYQQVINGSPAITYSCVQGGYTGTGNINQDPFFVDAIPALSYGSPCIDTGTIVDAPDHDIMKNPRPIGYGVDMGAYEGVYSTDFEGVVVINEVLAENETTNQDEDEDYSPWLELQNTSLSSVSLQGWTLTHNSTYWTFPNITLAGGEYRLVFLSGKNCTGSELHTNFTLSSQGGTILLQDNQAPVVNYMYFDYPADMPTDVSYGFNESDNVDPYNKELNPIQPLIPPTPEESNDKYLGNALVAYREYFPSHALSILPNVGGTRGYKTTQASNPSKQFYLNNLHKYNLFYVNAHGDENSLFPGIGFFEVSGIPDMITSFDIASCIQSSGRRYIFVHLNVCKSASTLLGSQWQEAFNAITFLGWDEKVFADHARVFDEYFYNEATHSSVSIAKGEAELIISEEYTEIAIAYQTHWPVLPFPNTVIKGNENLRLGIPDSAYNLP